VITGLGEKTDFVATVPNVDPVKLGLTPEERALFDRVGRASQIFQLVAGSSLPEPRTIALLLSLRAKGAIVPARVHAPQKPSPNTSSAALSEDVEISVERRKEILVLEEAVDSKNFFELLGVDVKTPAADVKAAYYEMSRKFHPDKYFQKNLGSFRARLERVFRQLTLAQETLTNATKRAAYLKANPRAGQVTQVSKASEVAKTTSSSSTPSKEPVNAPPTADELKREEERNVERRSRLARHPYLAKGQKVKELVKKAQDLARKGEWSQAFAQANAATQIDPLNREALKVLSEARMRNEFERAEAEFQKGQKAQEDERFALALAAFKTALSICPQHARAAYMIGLLALEKGADLQEAQSFAQKAVESDPKQADHQLLLARIHDRMGAKALAKKYYEEVLRLEPKNEEAKKHVKGRWPF
jgi:tetratricopeptide (TPR) repeat protein